MRGQDQSPGGEIGRRRGLKIPRRKACRFDSGPGHQLLVRQRSAQSTNPRQRKASRVFSFRRSPATSGGDIRGRYPGAIFGGSQPETALLLRSCPRATNRYSHPEPQDSDSGTRSNRCGAAHAPQEERRRKERREGRSGQGSGVEGRRATASPASRCEQEIEGCYECPTEKPAQSVTRSEELCSSTSAGAQAERAAGAIRAARFSFVRSYSIRAARSIASVSHRPRRIASSNIRSVRGTNAGSRYLEENSPRIDRTTSRVSGPK